MCISTLHKLSFLYEYSVQSRQCRNVKILRSEDQWISPKFNFIGWNNSDYFTCPENSMVTLSQKSRILKLNVCQVLWECRNYIRNFVCFAGTKQSRIKNGKPSVLFHLSPAWMRTPPLAWAVFRAILCKFTFLSMHGSMMDILSLFIKTFFCILHRIGPYASIQSFLTCLWGFRFFCHISISMKQVFLLLNPTEFKPLFRVEKFCQYNRRHHHHNQHVEFTTTPTQHQMTWHQQDNFQTLCIAGL